MVDSAKPAAMALGALLLLVFFCYAPALGNDFTMDDTAVAKGLFEGRPHPMIHELQPLSEYFSSHYWRGHHDVDNLYRPVTVLSYALRFQVCADNAAVAHLLNILLQLVATLLVYRMLGALGCSWRGSLAGAAVFGLHAIHSEVVVGIVGRAELLGFVFGAAALLCWQARGLWPKLISVPLLFLACASKENAVAWVPFIFVFGLARRWQKPSAGRPILSLLVSLIPLGLYLYLRWRMLSSLPHEPEAANYSVNPMVAFDLGERLCMGTYLLGYGLWLTLFPFDLSADYSIHVFPLVTSYGSLRFLLPAAVLLVVLLGGLVFCRRQPLLFLAMAAFLGFAFLTSNIPLPIGTIFGERLYYTPSLGLSFLVAWLWERPGQGEMAGKVLLGILVLWGAICSVVILQRNTVWKNDEALFLHEVKNQPRSVRMQMSAGKTYMDRGEIEKAIACVEEALAIEPEYGLAWLALGGINMNREGKLHEAEQQLERVLTSRYFHIVPDHSNAHYNLGLIAADDGRFEKAARHFEQALFLQPAAMTHFEELQKMADAGQLGGRQLESRLDELSKASSSPSPYLADYMHGYLGLLHKRAGRWHEAAPLLESALANIPSDDMVQSAAANMYLALADVYLATGQHGKVEPLLRPLARLEYIPELARLAKSKIDRARRR